MLDVKDMVLRHKDFEVSANLEAIEPGIYALIGPSGSGKSSFLMALAGFLQPAQGHVVWQGKDITSAPPSQRPISILFQDNNLFPHLTIKRNVAFAISQNAKLSKAEHAHIDQALTRVGLLEHAEKRPSELSGGQQGRAALARVLLQERPILLLDEPFAALGPALKKDMLNLVSGIAQEQNLTVIMVTHDIEDARSIAPLTLLIDQGAVRAPANTLDLLQNPPRSLQDYLGID